jgi:uncharacterized protein YndB with AHSA1/START domain
MTTTDHIAAVPVAGADYQTTIRIAADPEALFDALTDVAALSAWWVAATGSGEAGGELHFQMSFPEPLVVHVDEATPATVRWHVTACDFEPDWVGTRPTFTITPLDGETVELQFRHHGLTSELECIENCTNGWNHYIGSLRQYVESGQGSPRGSNADNARRVQERTAS